MKENQHPCVDQTADDRPCWLIAAARPGSDLQQTSSLRSLTRHANYRGQQLQLSIKPSTEWTSSDLCRLDSLVQDRNRFVCLQLVTMAREQHSKAAAATAAADAAALHAAKNTFLATASILPAASCQAAGTAEVVVVAAGLFYPRLASKDSQQQEPFPHVYLELMCCNRPGQGYGTLLLQHIEQFVADFGDVLSAGLFGSGGASTRVAAAAAAAAEPAAAGMAGRVIAAAAAGAAGGGHPGNSGSGSTMSDAVEDYAVIDIASDGCSTASRSSACQAGLTGDEEKAAVAAAAVPCAAAPIGGMLLPVLLPAGSLCCSGCGPTRAAAGGSFGGDTSGPRAAAAVPFDAAAARLIRGVKLLSVGGAQAWYARLGYRGPDGSHEMFKAL